MLCAAGTFSLENSTACTPCNPGRFSASAGASACVSCAVGSYCPAGSAAPLPCPAGTFSSVASVASAASCSLCVSSTPYSPPGSTSAANCSACASGCTSGTYGRVLQAAPVCSNSSWTLWQDVQGVEGNHSCLVYLPGPFVAFGAAGNACKSSGTHLISTKQVRDWDGMACTSKGGGARSGCPPLKLRVYYMHSFFSQMG